MTDDPRALPVHEGITFDRDAFDKAMVVYPAGWTVRMGDDARMTIQPKPLAHVVFDRQPAWQVRIYDVAGTLRTTAKSAEDNAIVDELFGRAPILRLEECCRDQVRRLFKQREERLAAFRAMPACESAVLTGAGFDELIASHPAADGWQIPIDDTDSVIVGRKKGDVPSQVLFVRRTAPSANLPTSYQRVRVYDFEGTLRTTAKTAEERGFLEEMYGRARPALERMLREREERVAKAIASAKPVDRPTLAAAVTAMTHGHVEVEPIAEAVMLASRDPRAYVATHADRCREFSIYEPVKGLHVLALLQHMPKAFLLSFDWKESMHEVLPMLVDLVKTGPGVSFDIAPFEKRCDAWDKRSRLTALKEVAPAIPGVTLVEIKTDSDSYAIACVAQKDIQHLQRWKRKAGLPLAALA